MKQLEVEISTANNNPQYFPKLDGECFRSTHVKTMAAIFLSKKSSSFNVKTERLKNFIRYDAASFCKTKIEVKIYMNHYINS